MSDTLTIEDLQKAVDSLPVYYFLDWKSEEYRRWILWMEWEKFWSEMFNKRLLRRKT